MNMDENKTTIYDRKGYKTMKDIKIACIFDVFTYACFKDICNFIKIRPDNWKEVFEKENPDFFMIESVWKGNDGTWMSGRNLVRNEDLKEVILWCNNHNIPTVFWNKEDPANFNEFIHVAKLFDYIFTSDENTVKEYKKYVNHDNIYPLMFAANPIIHNPIKIIDKRIEKCCFAGTFYRDEYKERGERIKLLLDASLKSWGVDIYDRTLNLGIDKYAFPDEYKQYVKGTLTQDEIQLANKGYKVMLNVNIVDDSPTMFARRVFEGLASYTPVVSTKSIGVKEVFEGLVVASDDEKELYEEMVKLNEKEYYEKKALQGMRLVLNNHTSTNRMVYILEKLNIKYYHTIPDVALICEVYNKEGYIKAKSIFERQIYRDKKLFIIIKDENINIEIDEQNKNIYRVNKNVLNNKDEFIKLLNCDYISVINLNNYYGAYYINDLINATLYSDAEIIGKKSFYSHCKYKLLNKDSISIQNENEDFQYVSSLDLDKSIFKTSILKDKNINSIEEIINGDKIDLFRFGCRYLSIDKFNFIENGSEVDEKIRRKIDI